MELRNGGKVAVAASCFSIYAFKELKTQLKKIDEFRFIFTSPTFVTEKTILHKARVSLRKQAVCLTKKAIKPLTLCNAIRKAMAVFIRTG